LKKTSLLKTAETLPFKKFKKYPGTNKGLLLPAPLQFSFCTSTNFKIPKLTLTYYLKNGHRGGVSLQLFIFFIHLRCFAGSVVVLFIFSFISGVVQVCSCVEQGGGVFVVTENRD